MEKSLKDLSGALGKMAENSPKIQKDVEKIREAICGSNGILESLVNINKNIEEYKKKSIADITSNKLNNKEDKNGKKLISSTNNMSKILSKILDRMKGGNRLGNVDNRTHGLTGANFQRRKDDTNKKVDRLGNISRAIDIIERLRNINLKDFMFAKQKLAHIAKIMSRSLNLFRMFKNNKEAQQTVSFIESSSQLIKKLAKIAVIGKLAQVGAKAIQYVFLGKNGKGGLLWVFREMHKHRKEIKNAKKDTGNIAKACGSLFLAALAMTGVAVLGVATLAGALLSAGIIVILLGTFKLVGNATTSLVKGAIAFSILSVGIIAFSLGFGLLRQAVYGVTLKEVGIMLAAVGGTSLLMAGIGLLAAPIALGGAALLIVGGSLALLNLGLRAWTNFDSKKPTDNIKYAIKGLKEAFGIGEYATEKDENGKEVKKGIGGSIGDFISSIFQGGKTLLEMGTILIATVAMAFVRLALGAWDNYTGERAIGNLKGAVTGLKDAFGLNDNKGEGNGKGFWGQIGQGFNDGANFLSSILQMGTTFAQMAAILMATVSMCIVRQALSVWDKYDGKIAIGNITNAVTGLKTAFGLTDNKGEGKGKGFWGQLGQSTNDMVALGSAVIQMGTTFVQMGTLLLATGLMDLVRVGLIPWEKDDKSKAIENMGSAITKLENVLGLNRNEEEPKKQEKKSWLGKAFDAVGDTLGAIGDTVSGVANAVSTVAGFGPKMASIANMIAATGSMLAVNLALKPWVDFDPTKPIDNMNLAMSGIKTMISDKNNKIDIKDSEQFEKGSKNVMKGMKHLTDGFRNAKTTGDNLRDFNKSLTVWNKYSYRHARTLAWSVDRIRYSFDKVEYKSLKQKSNVLMDLMENVHDNPIYQRFSSMPIAKSVRSINTLDIDKANKLNDLFKTIGLIKEERPFELFDSAVDKFIEGCHSIADYMGDIINPTANQEHNIFGFTKDGVQKKKSVDNGEGVKITNTQQLAEAIADALNNLRVHINPNMIDVNLIAESGTGKTVKLTIQD